MKLSLIPLALVLLATPVRPDDKPAAPVAATAKPASKIEYTRDVRPILAENCFACHGPDSAARKAKLRLDRREDAVKAGAITPGKPDESLLVDRILAEE